MNILKIASCVVIFFILLFGTYIILREVTRSLELEDANEFIQSQPDSALENAPPHRIPTATPLSPEAMEDDGG